MVTVPGVTSWSAEAKGNVAVNGVRSNHVNAAVDQAALILSRTSSAAQDLNTKVEGVSEFNRDDAQETSSDQVT